MTEEIWKDIKNYEGLYKISNLGQVKSLTRNIILKTATDKKGYLRVSLCKNCKDKYYRIHRLVLQAFIGNSDLQCNHINGIKNDNRLENLEWVTSSENMKHSYRIGVHKIKKGENGTNVKLKKEDVILIRKLCSIYHIKHKTISCLFDINKSTVSAIVTGRNWSNVS